MWCVVFLSLSKIPCTGHQICYSENTDEVPNLSPQGKGTLSNFWGLGFVCGLIPLVLMPSPPPPPHTHSWEKYSLYAAQLSITQLSVYISYIRV